MVWGRARAISSTAAMRTLTAILILAACSCLRAERTRDVVQETLRSLLGEQHEPIQRLATCSQTLGITKCLSALSVWRAESAIEAFATNPRSKFNLTEDVERFPWMKYSNTSEEQLYSQLCDDTEKLLEHRSLMLDVVPGYEIRLKSKGNGTVSLDLFKGNNEQSGRGMMKKLQKKFYQIMPLLALPGLIMGAVLPFVLPGLKMMTLAAVMLNNMALMGAIFTLLRNNAFNDKYEHKVLYVNKGYKNEKPVTEEHIHTSHDGVFYADDRPIEHDINILSPENTYGDFDSIDELPTLSINNGWIQNPKVKYIT